MVSFPSTWRNLQRVMDSMIDGQFSEPVEIHPWTGGQHAADDGAPDPTRAVLYTNAMYVVPGSRATGEAGTRAAGITTKIQTADEWISITEDAIGSPENWTMYDRVYLKERQPGEQWHTIAEIIPSATGRFDIHLIRLKE